MKNLSLKYPPIKLHSNRISDKFVYHVGTGKNVVTGEIRDKFIMLSTKESCKGVFAVMECTKENISRDGLVDVPSLFINHLLPSRKGYGFGTAFLDFAREYSKKVGCLGNIHLSPNSAYDPHRIPHVFYRKYGMNTNDASVNKKLDRFVRQGKDASFRDFKDGVIMYYPPIKSPVTRWQKFINFMFNREICPL